MMGGGSQVARRRVGGHRRAATTPSTATCAVALLCVVLLPAAHAWWEVPHKLTAAVAWQKLSPHVREDAEALIDVLSAYYDTTTDFVSSAIWPDDLKSFGVHQFDGWHYIDYPYVVDGVDPALCDVLEDENVVWAMGQNTEVLRSPASSPLDRAIALRFLIHFFGDIHQPLHCVSRCSAEHPTGDLGGNWFNLDDDQDEGGHSLHSFWDSGGGQYDHLERESPLDDVVASLIQEFPEPALPELGTSRHDNFTAWSLESYGVALQHAYSGVVHQGIVTDEYRTQAQAMVRRRVVLGGTRLARLLTDIHGRNPSFGLTLSNGDWSGYVAAGRPTSAGVWVSQDKYGVMVDVVTALAVLCAFLLTLTVALVLSRRGRSSRYADLLEDDGEGAVDLPPFHVHSVFGGDAHGAFGQTADGDAEAVAARAGDDGDVEAGADPAAALEGKASSGDDAEYGVDAGTTGGGDGGADAGGATSADGAVAAAASNTKGMSEAAKSSGSIDMYDAP